MDQNAFPGVAGAEVVGAGGIVAYMAAGFRRAWPLAPTWALVLFVGLAGQLGSFLMLFMLGHPTTTMHIAYHVVVGIVASSGEPLVKSLHAGAERLKNGDGDAGRHGTLP